MKENNRLIVVVGVVAFAAFLFTPLTPAEGQVFMTLAGGSRLRWSLTLAAIFALPLAFALPLVRASFMGKYWKVPSTTYLLPRWLVRVACGTMAGQAAATLTLALTRDERMLWLLPFQLLIGGAFCLGTCRRLKTPASNEFAMPWWPRIR